MITTIAECWVLYQKAVGIEHASEIVKHEMRKVFYAGVAAMYEISANASAMESIDEGAAVIEAAEDELEAYEAELGARVGARQSALN